MMAQPGDTPGAMGPTTLRRLKSSILDNRGSSGQHRLTCEGLCSGMFGACPTTTSWTTPPTPDSRATEAGTPLSHFLSPRSSTRSSTPASLTWRETPFCPGPFPSGEPTLSYRLFHTSLTPLLLKVMRYTSFGDGPTTQRFPEQRCSLPPRHPQDGAGRGLVMNGCYVLSLVPCHLLLIPIYITFCPLSLCCLYTPHPFLSYTGASLSCISDLTFEPPSWGRKVTS